MFVVSLVDPFFVDCIVFEKDTTHPSQHFNVGNNVDLTLKMKQNPTSDFQRCTTLIQCQWPTFKQRRKNVTQRWNNVVSTWYQALTLVKAILNPIGLVMIVDCEIVEYMLNTWIVFILLHEKIFFYYILTILPLMKYQETFLQWCIL